MEHEYQVLRIFYVRFWNRAISLYTHLNITQHDDTSRHDEAPTRYTWQKISG